MLLREQRRRTGGGMIDGQTTALQPPRASFNSRGYCEGMAKEAERGEVVTIPLLHLTSTTKSRVTIHLTRNILHLCATLLLRMQHLIHQS
jgi:hypothetical protein